MAIKRVMLNDEKEDFSEMKEMTVTTIIISDVTMTQGHDIGNCAVFESDDNHQRWLK